MLYDVYVYVGGCCWLWFDGMLNMMFDSGLYMVFVG